MAQQIQPNVPGNYLQGLTGGLQAGQAVNRMQTQNALAKLFQNRGDALMAGNPEALNALAGIGPEGFQMAYDMKRQGKADARADERFAMETEMNEANLANIRQTMEIRTAEEARKISAAEREENARQVAASLSGAAAAYEQGPEAISAWAQENAANLQEAGLDPAGIDYESFPSIVAALEGAQNGLAAGVEMAGSFSETPEQSAREEQIARIAALPDPNNPGQPLGRENAILFVDDIIKVSRNPRTEQAELIDTRTGGVWQGTASAGGQGTPAPQQGQQQGGGLTPGGGVSGSSLTAAPGQGTPQAAPTPQVGDPQLSYGDQFPNTQDSFGVEGFARRAVNTAFGAAGAEPPYPDVESTQAEFAVLKEFTTRDIANAYQRQPPARIMDNIQRLIPDAGRIFEGGSRAQSQLEALKQSLGTELGSVDDQLRNRQLSPDDRADLESQKTGLTNAMRRLDVAIQSFDRDPGGSGADASGDDAALINKWLED